MAQTSILRIIQDDPRPCEASHSLVFGTAVRRSIENGHAQNLETDDLNLFALQLMTPFSPLLKPPLQVGVSVRLQSSYDVLHTVSNHKTYDR